jgi:hypothetical protein
MRRRLFVQVNRLTNAIVRRLGLTRFRGADVLLLTTTGRTTGRTRLNDLVFDYEGYQRKVSRQVAACD